MITNILAALPVKVQALTFSDRNLGRFLGRFL